MASISKEKLSHCTNGLAIKVAATSSAGTDIHTAVAGTTNIDEIWLWAINTDPADKELTIQFGGTTSPDNDIELTVSGEAGLVQIVPGLLLHNGLTIKAFAETTNVIQIYGFVNRITA